MALINSLPPINVCGAAVTDLGARIEFAWLGRLFEESITFIKSQSYIRISNFVCLIPIANETNETRFSYKKPKRSLNHQSPLEVTSETVAGELRRFQ